MSSSLPAIRGKTLKPPSKEPVETFKATLAQLRCTDMLISDAEDCAVGGGSRSGKTFWLLRAVIMRALRVPGSKHCIFRYRFNAVVRSIIYATLPKVMEMCFPGLNENCNLNKTLWFLTLPNGSEVWFGGLDDKERVEKILGNEYSTIYFNECSEIPYQSVVIALTRLAENSGLALKAYYDFNPPSKRHWTYRWFVLKQNPESKRPLDNPQTVGFYRINPIDNQNNLPAAYLRRLDGLPPKARSRFLLGQFAEDADGQLWTEEVIETNRRMGGEREPLPEFIRIVIAIDPSGSAGEEDFRSDEIGITVVDLGRDGHAYLLEDLSDRYSPTEWGTIACDTFGRYEADCIVAESNFGGEMVRNTIQTINRDVPVKLVRASRGKVVRAEPVASLYEMGKIHHVGQFPEIEDQLCSFSTAGYQGLRSPDRADSLVWAIMELFPSLTESGNARKQRQELPQVIRAPRAASSHARTIHRVTPRRRR